MTEKTYLGFTLVGEESASIDAKSYTVFVDKAKSNDEIETLFTEKTSLYGTAEAIKFGKRNSPVAKQYLKTITFAKAKARLVLNLFEDGQLYHEQVNSQTLKAESQTIDDEYVQNMLLRALSFIRKNNPKNYRGLTIDIKGFCKLLEITDKQFFYNADFLEESCYIKSELGLETGCIYITRDGLHVLSQESLANLEVGESEMNSKEFIEALHRLKTELTNEVIGHYQAGNQERGSIAFERWKERVNGFLKAHVPSEAKRFEEKMEHYGFAVVRNETPYQTFMREDGDTCFAFVDDLIDSAEKDRISLTKSDSDSSNEDRDSIQVFVSYAGEDVDAARRLYDGLEKSGLSDWFDRESLLPGQQWKSAIRLAIEASRFFIALLSESAINKKGYVQKEIKAAFEILEEYPSPSIFVIPVRLENCSPLDERMKDLHWVDMYPEWERGLGRILDAINSQLGK